jgi:hypothetical protein
MNDTTPAFNQLNIIANDFDRTLESYRRLGADVPDGASPPDGTCHTTMTLPNGVTFEVDNSALAKIYNAEWRRPEDSSPVLIGFSFPTRQAVN